MATKGHHFPCLSRRGQETASTEGFSGKYLTVALNNSYNSVTNEQGIINLGNAANTLMGAELQERLRREDCLTFTAVDHMAYFNLTGIPKAKAAISNFFREWFSQGIEIPEDELYIMNGATACLEALSYACLDAGDTIITPTPVYGRVFTNFTQRFGVDVQALDLMPKTSSSQEDFQLNVGDLETKISDLLNDGKNVKAFILLNPQNPLGVVYSEETLVSILNICAKYKMHFIIDEIYGLSVYDEKTKFKSILSFENIPDPERTHFVYGMSKDFGLAGLRFGIIHSRAKGMDRLLTEWSSFQSVASVVQDTVATMLTDTEWCKSFLNTKNLRLKENFTLVKETLGSIGVNIVNSSGGLFAWADFSRFLDEPTKEAEIKLFESILSSGVYIVPGFVMYSRVSGWYRIVFSSDLDVLRIGLQRIVTSLKAIEETKG